LGFTLFNNAILGTSRTQIGSYRSGANRITINLRDNSLFDLISYERGTTYALNSIRIRTFLNGVITSAYTANAPLSANSFLTRIGSGIGANLATGIGGADVDIAEVIVYNSILDSWERESIEYYLAQKWNLPRLVYAIRNGWWRDTNNWSISGYTAPFNLPKENDWIFTNSFRMSAEIGSFPYFQCISNRDTTVPVIAGGGSIQFFSNTTTLSVNQIDNISTGSFFLVNSGYCGFYGNSSIGYNSFKNAGQGTIRALSGTTVYLSGYNFNSVSFSSTTDRVCVQAISANLILDNVFFNRGSNDGQGDSNRVFWTGGRDNYFLLRDSVVGEENSSYNFSRNIILSGWFTNAYINNCVIYGQGSGDGYTTENIRSVIELGNVYFNNCYFKTPDNAAAVSYQGATVSRNGNGYFNNCTFNTGYNLSRFYVRGRSNVVLLESASGYFVDCKYISYGFEHCVRGYDTSICVLSSTYLIDLNSYAFMGAYGAVVSAYNYNLLSDYNGVQPILSPNFYLINGAQNSYIKQNSNANDSVYYWTSGTTFSYPSARDVRLNVRYNNNNSIGTMVVPPPSSVILLSPVDNTVGTATLTVSDVINYPIQNIPNDNSIGAKLKNITTSSAFSGIVLNSFNFSNYQL
jgi:hypothetical protein